MLVVELRLANEKALELLVRDVDGVRVDQVAVGVPGTFEAAIEGVDEGHPVGLVSSGLVEAEMKPGVGQDRQRGSAVEVGGKQRRPCGLVRVLEVGEGGSLGVEPPAGRGKDETYAPSR